MYKTLFNLLILQIFIIIVSCDGSKTEITDPTSEFGRCGEVTPTVAIQEKGDGLELTGFIYAQVLEGVHHIELSSEQAIFGSLNGDSLVYNVSSANHEGTMDNGLAAWILPFVVNQTSADYVITVKYYCNPSDDEVGVPGGDAEGDPELSVGYSIEFDYNPGHLCDTGGENLFISEAGTLINDIANVGSISSRIFNIKWQTRPPSSDNEGFLFLFPIEEIESAYLEMTDISGENTLSKQFNVNWYTKPWIEEGVHYGDFSYLSANINITDMVSGLEEEELAKYRSIKFVIKYCGGKEFNDYRQFGL